MFLELLQSCDLDSCFARRLHLHLETQIAYKDATCPQWCLGSMQPFYHNWKFQRCPWELSPKHILSPMLYVGPAPWGRATARLEHGVSWHIHWRDEGWIVILPIRQFSAIDPWSNQDVPGVLCRNSWQWCFANEHARVQCTWVGCLLHYVMSNNVIWIACFESFLLWPILYWDISWSSHCLRFGFTNRDSLRRASSLIKHECSRHNIYWWFHRFLFTFHK